MLQCANSVNDAPWYSRPSFQLSYQAVTADETCTRHFAGAGQGPQLGSIVHSVPGFEDPLHDAMLALMEWVEKGVAPDQIIATKFVNDTVALGVQSQRPLCPYPAQAQYVQEDVKNASSFVCG